MKASVRKAFLLGAVLSMLLPIPSRAQSGFAFLVAPGAGARVIASTSVQLSLKGSVVVTFHGDPATRCASRGLCGYSGVAIWRLDGAPASLQIVTLRRHGRIHYEAAMFFFGGGPPGQVVSSSVRREAAGQVQGTCADTSSPAGNTVLSVHAGRLPLSVLTANGGVLSTRCAGPLDGDIARFLPTRSLTIGAALGGHRRVDLGVTRSFAANGFAGTIRSTVALALGSPSPNPSAAPAPGPAVPRLRVVSESLSLVRLSGSLTARVRGAANPDVCALLDSCAAHGAIVLNPHPIAEQGELSAFGPARRPYRDYLAALGLGHGGNPAGIIVSGSIGWNSGGTLAEQLTQAGQCSDSRPLGEGYLGLQSAGKRLIVSYFPNGPLRVRCPGPELGSSGSVLASRSIPVRALARRELSISLPSVPAFADDGYTGTVGGALAITFRRGPAKQSFLGAG